MPLLTVAEDEPTREVTLDEVVIKSPKVESTDATLGASSPTKADREARQATTGDAADLLRSVPGVSLNGAGGISSLPAIHGLSDDRLRIQVDGMDLMPACPNHMNSPLSYADPTRIESVTVYSGITPVSVGGCTRVARWCEWLCPARGKRGTNALANYYEHSAELHNVRR